MRKRHYIANVAGEASEIHAPADNDREAPAATDPHYSTLSVDRQAPIAPRLKRGRWAEYLIEEIGRAHV